MKSSGNREYTMRDLRGYKKINCKVQNGFTLLDMDP